MADTHVSTPDRSDTDSVTVKVPDKYGDFQVPSFNKDGQVAGGTSRSIRGGTVITVPKWFARETLGVDFEEYASEKGEKSEKPLDLTGNATVEEKEGKTVAKDQSTANERAMGNAKTTAHGTGPAKAGTVTRASDR